MMFPCAWREKRGQLRAWAEKDNMAAMTGLTRTLVKKDEWTSFIRWEQERHFQILYPEKRHSSSYIPNEHLKSHLSIADSAAHSQSSETPAASNRLEWEEDGQGAFQF